jgi:hypothetical protein
VTGVALPPTGSGRTAVPVARGTGLGAGAVPVAGTPGSAVNPAATLTGAALFPDLGDGLTLSGPAGGAVPPAVVAPGPQLAAASGGQQPGSPVAPATAGLGASVVLAGALTWAAVAGGHVVAARRAARAGSNVATPVVGGP